ncbi:DNA-binding MarR family transcriptional regulator [Streptosporangium album]|uniref:DNA-binding MarR family transcriptional regulator n=1 Tax=Streptosporangium album TaxID=47479 RepID=A0A7W7RXW3_9ACTN|nr:MarR family winged helix-turn-helix transcriptional regulator [Streptosporangium album]MBB4939371.1 DNA-binding MarR family transcriptional regulator [Streptosporangium album]
METPEDRFFGELGGAYAEIRQAFARHVGMSAPRLRVLMRLWRDGETSHSDLRRILSLDGASVTRLIKEFEAEGLVSRRIDPADNRYTLANLTPAGAQAAAELARSHQAYQVRLLDGVTAEEQETVLRALTRVCANVDRIERDPQGR